MADFKTRAAIKQMARFGEKKSGKIAHVKIKVGEEEFDSIAEHDRYIELLLMQKAGVISDLECHPSYEVIPRQETPEGKQNFRSVIYTPDFRYKRNGKEISEEIYSFLMEVQSMFFNV